MEEIIRKLTANDDVYACAVADRIISESQDTDAWYPCFDMFAALLDHPKSLVRNRALHILAANAQWDTENRFDTIWEAYQDSYPYFQEYLDGNKPFLRQHYFQWHYFKQFIKRLIRRR